MKIKNTHLSFKKRAPFIALHLLCVLVITVNFSWSLLVFCIASTYLRLLGITAGFHRYFSHKTYKTSRLFQFILALLGTFSAQQGPLWWAAHHRHHHRHSDTELDIHSPKQNGFFYAHLGWLFNTKNKYYDSKYIKDLTKFPELVIIEKYYYLVILGYAFLISYIGSVTPIGAYPALVWGFVVSTVLLYHLTFTINSVLHTFGKRNYNTPDSSRNNFMLSIFILGEAWHNNHHRYPHSERQGFVWWQIDITHYFIKAMEKIGLLWDIKTPPKSVLIEGGYS
ncbi:acyl-CoA desaturase [Candidatus Marinamargulisbacteria bacterium SCGC AAA071-K20]|nr:acyl-CoA desaturase [Candidatus Marinamargulisbacteria bacterium SCGC AAA071-K20]